MAITPDGARIVTAASDKSARVFEVATGKQTHILAGHGDAVRGVAVSKDGQTVATASADKTARTWNAADGKPKLVYGLAVPTSSVAFAPDGKTLAVGLADGSAKALDLAEADPAKAERTTFPGQGGPVLALAITPDGATLATGSDEQERPPLAPSRGRAGRSSGHTAQVYAVAWSAGGNQVVTGGGGASVRIWDVAKGVLRSASIRPPGLGLRRAGPSQGGPDRPPAATTRGSVKLLESGRRQGLRQRRGARRPRSTAWRLPAWRDDDRLAAASTRPIRLWNVADGKELQKLEGHPDVVYSLAFRGDGKQLASARLRLRPLPLGRGRGRQAPLPAEGRARASSPSASPSAPTASGWRSPGRTRRSYLFEVPAGA